QPYLKLGNMYLDNDYDKEAAQVFQNAILANDSEGEAHQGLAEALQKQKQYEEAIKEFQKAVQANGELYLAYYNIGHTYVLLGDKKQAKEWLDKFIKGYAGKTGPELAKAASDEMYALAAPESTLAAPGGLMEELILVLAFVFAPALVRAQGR